MPYKNPEHKRQWERKHRGQRNARRRMQRSDLGSRQRTPPKSTFDLRTALRSARKPVPDPVSGQKPKDTWRSRIDLEHGFGRAFFCVLSFRTLRALNLLGRTT